MAASKHRPGSARAVIVAALVAGLATVWLLGGSGRSSSSPKAPDLGLVTAPARPDRPVMAGEPHRTVPMPTMPPADRADLRAVYERASAQGIPPGQAAFRRMISRFMEYNAEFARAKAAKEGLTVAEIEELTYLGYMVLATQQPPEIEELVGRTLSDDEKQRLEALQHEQNDTFTDAMHDLVARGASEEERWALIEATEKAYVDGLYGITGLDDQTFDDLLAGDLARSGGPMQGDYPDDIEPRPYVSDETTRPAQPR